MPRRRQKSSWRPVLRRIAWIGIYIVLGVIATSIAAVAVFRFVPVPVTPLMVLRLVDQWRDDRRVVRLEKDWVGLDEISPALQLAAVCAEDQRFLDHHGFDFEAIRKAIRHNETSRTLRGASTISQQTAKNVFLWDGRTWLRKGLEVWFTAWIELLWTKERILTVYLNVVELGDGVYGAEAAAQRYFRKPARDLTRDEAALLAATLPSPLRYSAANPSPYVRQRQRWILEQMRNWPRKGLQF